MRAILQSVGRHAATGAVLGVLVGLLGWGHHYHWKAPPFAALWSSQATAEQAAKSEDLRAEVVAVETEGEETPGPPSRYQIRFRSPGAMSKAGIRTAEVAERSLARYVVANGVLDFDQTRYAELSSRAPGTVWSVEKQEGDAVRKGDVLALVACADVGRAKSDFLHALWEVAVKSRALQYMQAAAGAIPERQLREGDAQLRAARIRLLSDQQALVNFGLSIRLEDWQDLSEDQAAARVRVLGLPEHVARSDPASLPANLLPMTAPFDGRVVRRDMVVGEVVGTTQPLFVVADLRRLWILLDVRLEDADLLALGQEVTFQSDSGSGHVARGQVTWISPGVDKKTRTVRVRAEVDNRDDRLRPDTFGTGRLLVRSSARALAVPPAAVQSRDGSAVVFVRLGEGIFEERRVDLGDVRDDDFVEVRAGICPGDEVVVAGSHVLKSEIVRSLLAGHPNPARPRGDGTGPKR